VISIHLITSYHSSPSGVTRLDPLSGPFTCTVFKH